MPNDKKLNVGRAALPAQEKETPKQTMLRLKPNISFYLFHQITFSPVNNIKIDLSKKPDFQNHLCL